MIERLYSAVKRRRRGLAITSESGTGRRGPGAEDEVLVLFLLIKVRFLSPPYSNCPGSTCLTHLGTEGWGTTAQKQEYLPVLARGEKLGAFALNESGPAVGI